MSLTLDTPRRRGRPPKALAGLSETRAALIRAGVAVLTEKGFSAAGLDEILKSVGVPKGSFYHYFDSKEAFGLALIDSYNRYFLRKLDRHLQDSSLPPLQRLKNFIADARAGMVRFDFARGCLIGTLGQEMGALPASFRQHLIDVFTGWQGRLVGCLRQAQATGALAPDADCTALAEFFWIGWEGAVLRARLERTASPLDRFAELYLRLLQR